MLAVIISTLILFFSTCLSLTAPNILSTADKQKILDAHNNYRSQAAIGNISRQPPGSNINYLFWDEGLAMVASNFSKTCNYANNLNAAQELSTYSTTFGQPAVESLEVGQNPCARSGSISDINQLLDCILEWYDQNTVYNFTTDPNDDASFYVQLIYHTTRYVGCGFYSCSNGISNTGYSSTSYIFICNYYPPKYGFSYPYTNDTACTGCDSDRTQCVNSLCGGCVNSNYNLNYQSTTNDCDNGLGVNVTNSGTVITHPTPKPTPKPISPTFTPTMYPTNTGETFSPTKAPTNVNSTSDNSAASIYSLKCYWLIYLYIIYIISLFL